MRRLIPISCRMFLVLVLICPFRTPGQAQNPSKPQPDDVIRVNTELVQTDVMVFDKKGRFVDGLRPEQFKLTLDGQERKPSIFERITSGSRLEASQLATVGAGSTITNPKNISPVVPSTSGRLIFFFVDDVHLSGESLARARTALSHLVSGTSLSQRVVFTVE